MGPRKSNKHIDIINTRNYRPRNRSNVTQTSYRSIKPNSPSRGNISSTPNLNNLSRRQQKNRHSKKRLIFKIMIPLLVIIIGGVTLYSWYINNQIKRVQVNGLSSSVGGAENILIAGSTTRCGLKVQNAQWGFCSDGVTGVNSDIIMVVHLVPATHSITLLSIPRDTFVPNARAGAEAFKIDAALYEGPSQLVNAIEEDFGIPIQHYVELNFDGFVNVVNALGGIKMNFPLPVYDAYSHLDIKQAGAAHN